MIYGINRSALIAQKEIYLSFTPRKRLIAIKLLRTDTTLDLSHYGREDLQVLSSLALKTIPFTGNVVCGISNYQLQTKLNGTLPSNRLNEVFCAKQAQSAEENEYNYEVTRNIYIKTQQLQQHANLRKDSYWKDHHP
jgi:hypothetical protein